MQQVESQTYSRQMNWFSDLAPRQLALILQHLASRMRKPSEKRELGIVFDVTYWCDACCPWCTSEAKLYHSHGTVKPTDLELPHDAVCAILGKIYTHIHNRDIRDYFLNFGGGDPFMRYDFPEIVIKAAELFGPQHLGFDHNGTVSVLRPDAAEQLKRIVPRVSYVGISLDGLEGHHNRERDPHNRLGNMFQHALQTISMILAVPGGQQALEVSTVATRENLDQIPYLMRLLHKLGVRKYSVHRTMQSGRGFTHFYYNRQRLPHGRDYIQLLAAMLEANEELGMDIHIHHSLESVYTSILLGQDTYAEGKDNYPDKRSSIAIDPRGNVFFDPWCMHPPLARLSSVGSLVDPDVTLAKILDHGLLAKAREQCHRGNRCGGCPQPCSGGSRIAALTHYLMRNGFVREEDITEERLLKGLAEIDPDCPLWGETIS